MKKKLLGMLILVSIIGTSVPSVSFADYEEDNTDWDKDYINNELEEDNTSWDKDYIGNESEDDNTSWDKDYIKDDLEENDEEEPIEEDEEDYNGGIVVSRISGLNRYLTSVEASKKTFRKSEYAIIASGDGFADALVGGTLASQLNAPMLLVSKDTILPEVLNELERLKVEKVYLLGGTTTISSQIGDKIKSLGVTVERLFGENRIETAEKIEEVRFEHASYIIPGEYYAVIDGNNFADALSAAPFIGQMSPTTYLYPYVKNSKNNKPYYMAIGGYSSVPKGEQERIRISGSNRFETAVEVAKSYRRRLEQEIDTIVLVDGLHYPDALASASVASMNNGAILLTSPNSLPAVTKNFIKSNRDIRKIIIVGGESSVSNSIKRELENIVR